MPQRTPDTDPLFLEAEQLANDFSLFPSSGTKPAAARPLLGVLDEARVDAQLRYLRQLNVDEYVRQTVAPSEDPTRQAAPAIVRGLGGRIITEISLGPLYAVEMKLDFGGRTGERRVGILAQNRAVANGVWMPEHHLMAVGIIREFTEHNIPLVTLIDTPGADAGETANRNNQAHAISRLIAEFAQLDLPTIGIVIGNGYSGGAIPLATTNILLSVRDGVFNTIQPRGLASIARKYDLSWQECAKFVGVSSYELLQQGYIDGIVDYVPGEANKINNLTLAIISGIEKVEQLATHFAREHANVLEHYHRSVERFLDPSRRAYSPTMFLSLAQSPTSQASAFGVVFRYLRYLRLRQRLRSKTIEGYGRLSGREIPKGDLTTRLTRERDEAFQRWLASPLALRYDEVLNRTWKLYQGRKREHRENIGRFRKLFIGNPAKNLRLATRALRFQGAFSLYSMWKGGAQQNLLSLIRYLEENTAVPANGSAEMNILDLIVQPELRRGFIREFQNVIIFDLLYDNIVDNLKNVAREAKDTNTISAASVRALLDQSLAAATKEVLRRQGAVSRARRQEQLRRQFVVWLVGFARLPLRGNQLKSIEEWKKISHPRVSEPLFAIITFFFEHLLPQFLESSRTGRPYQGRITPRNIGMKDFWHRLTIAYHDLLIQEVLTKHKEKTKTPPQLFIDTFFTSFQELHGSLMTADPVSFPGFRLSIEQALDQGVKPCGVITGLGRLKLKIKGERRWVGVMISNLPFQAGAFDMASGEKFCKLLVECAIRKLPVVCFVSSGGMQTKEGAGALFSMAIVNDRITRFIRDNDLPIIVFGFGDCTGGAQASMVTHPLVHTYYFSGTNMPFAGQIVVPSYLPYAATLSNYLSVVESSMQGLVKHPFIDDLDDELRAIDPTMPVAREGIADVLGRILTGENAASIPAPAGEMDASQEMRLMRPITKVLLHARGCAALRILKKAQAKGIPIVLIQSDPDMDSVAASSIGPNDMLVCIGGNSPDESYLNARSVIRVAEHSGCDALHPGIGFLSESPDFATLCRSHDLNFLGPPTESMDLMGNKSNAINTAKRLNIPVVPGSHGIVTHVDAALKIAEEIGYPIAIKAVHGGGGKGIVMLNSADELPDAFRRICAEAKNAFGSSDVYIEKCVLHLRHVEIQILRDKYGHCKVLGLRDCTVQRSHQKVVEESGSVVLPKNLKDIAFDAAYKIANDINYIGAGTVEFMYDMDRNAIYFMEMNTRLQVEHPVTEAVSGVDIVGAQFDIGAGASIDDMKVRDDGYCIEVRVNAERAVLESGGQVVFLPDPGLVTTCKFPEAPDIEVIATIAKGKTVSPYYDSMVAQVIAKGKDRTETVDKLVAYLETIKIEGISTNIPLIKRILRDDVFRKGNYTTTYLLQFLARIDLAALCADSEASAGLKRKALTRDMLRIENSDELKVIAPSTGVFYTSASPKDPPYVVDGATIDTNQTLCLLEAMKVFRSLNLNRFNATGVIYDPARKFRVIRVVPTTGQAVSAGDLLFIVKPLA